MTDFEPTIIAFVCNWCTYTGADLAGISRIQWDPSVSIVRVMCSGRMDPTFVVKALSMGADGVIISGCHPGDCHYIKGNLFARRRMLLLKNLMDYMGLDHQRLRMSWVSAAEGGKYTGIIRDFTDDLRALGPQVKLRRQV